MGSGEAAVTTPAIGLPPVGLCTSPGVATASSGGPWGHRYHTGRSCWKRRSLLQSDVLLDRVDLWEPWGVVTAEVAAASEYRYLALGASGVVRWWNSGKSGPSAEVSGWDSDRSTAGHRHESRALKL